jgi:hypothetical protein
MEPSVADVAASYGVEGSRLVQEAGMSVRDPSGRTKMRSSLPWRRIQPSSGSARPSNGWRARTTVTSAG